LKWKDRENTNEHEATNDREEYLEAQLEKKNSKNDTSAIAPLSSRNVHHTSPTQHIERHE